MYSVNEPATSQHGCCTSLARLSKHFFPIFFFFSFVEIPFARLPSRTVIGWLSAGGRERGERRERGEWREERGRREREEGMKEGCIRKRKKLIQERGVESARAHTREREREREREKKKKSREGNI